MKAYDEVIELPPPVDQPSPVAPPLKSKVVVGWDGGGSGGGGGLGGGSRESAGDETAALALGGALRWLSQMPMVGGARLAAALMQLDCHKASEAQP